MIKAVIFDCGGVLHTSTDYYTTKSICKLFKISKSKYQKASQKYINLLATGKISEKTFWERFIKDIKSKNKLPTKSPWEKEYLARYKIHEDVINIVKKLKKLGYKTAVLSNTIPLHAKINKQKGVYDYFDQVILSHKVGFRKPDPEIYFLTLKKLKIKASEAIFIDDKPINIETAQKIGFETILFLNEKQLKKDLVKLSVFQNDKNKQF